jgi:two-component system chemotaxis response regulator CheB
MVEPAPTRIRVMLVDDAVVVRGMLRRILEQQPDFEIVASCGDGQAALAQYRDAKPDVVLMDIEMPRMDGMTALRQLLVQDAQACVIMCSSLTGEGANASMEALAAGALDYIAKPTTQDMPEHFAQKLVCKVRNLNKQAQRAASAPARAGASALPVLKARPSLIAIGASTGGPVALKTLLGALAKPLPCPVLVTQHIPAGHSAALADHLARQTGQAVHEAEDGMALQNGHVYIARGGRHMGVRTTPTPQLTLTDGPAVNFCKPAVDVMFNSLHENYGGSILALILTGMGEDGCRGAAALARQLGNVIWAQDEQSSIVWGMPGAVVRAGLAQAVLPVAAMAAAINQCMKVT